MAGRLIDLQRRLVEVGRIRMGASSPSSGGRKIPRSLGAWRFTSRDEHRILAIAEIYGGEARPWQDRPGEFEVFTDADRIPILLIPGQALSQAWELWGQEQPKGPVICLRRCDGERQTDDSPCACPPADERDQLAAQGKACRPVSRLNVLLHDVPGIGAWRLESHGFYAAVELAGMVDVFEEIAHRGGLYPAALRIDRRQITRREGTRKFAVPVIDILARVADLMPIATAEAPIQPLSDPDASMQLPASGGNGEGHTPLQRPELEGPSLQDSVAGLAERPAPHGKRAEPILTPPPDLEGMIVPTPPDEGIHDEEEPAKPEEPTRSSPRTEAPQEVIPEVINDRQRRFLHARKRELGLSDEELKNLIEEQTGQRSTTSIPAGGFDDLLGRMEAKAIRREADEAEEVNRRSAKEAL